MRESLTIKKVHIGWAGKCTSKLTDIDKCIQNDSKKLKESEEDPTYSEEQRQLYRDRLEDLNTQARLEILSQSQISDNYHSLFGKIFVYVLHSQQVQIFLRFLYFRFYSF